MNILIISIVSIALYVVAGIIQGMNLNEQLRYAKVWLVGLGFFAICLHAVLLHQWIDISVGQNLNFFNMFSLTAWLVAIIVLVMALVKPIEILVIFIFPVAAISILLVLGFPNEYIVNTAANPDTLFHILLSILTFCVLCVAGLLAILLAVQDYVLRRKQGNWMIQKMPPLESLEKLLFQVISLGFILLSVVIVTSFYFFHGAAWESASLLQKTILVGVAWVIFAILLVGRSRWGWRGKRAIYGTIGGVSLLFLAYFGSKLVLEALH